MIPNVQIVVLMIYWSVHLSIPSRKTVASFLTQAVWIYSTKHPTYVCRTLKNDTLYLIDIDVF